MCTTPLFSVPAVPSLGADNRSQPGLPDTLNPIISIHLVDTGIVDSFRRKAPSPFEVAGLRGTRKILSAPFSGSHVARPQPSRGGIIAFWDDEEALDDFLIWHPLAEDLNRGWNVRLQPLQASGAWSGLRVALPPEASVAHVGATAVLTIGRVKPHRFGGLQRHNVQIERQLLASKGFLWGTGLAGPGRLLATLSVWDSPGSLSAFARHGAHHAGVKASVPSTHVKGQPPFVDGTTFFDEAAFVRCRPFGAMGHLSGRNPMPCIELPATPIPI